MAYNYDPKSGLKETTLGDYKSKAEGDYTLKGYDTNNANQEVYVKHGYYTPGISSSLPRAADAPTTTPEITPDVIPDVVTSEDAKSGLNDIDAEIAKLGLESPDAGMGDQYYKDKEKLLQQQYETKAKQIRDDYAKRTAGQEQAGKQIMGQSRAALASLGILSDDPTTIGQTPAIQYVADVKNENQRKMDEILAEEQQMLMLAKDAKDSGQLALAKDKYDEAQKLREEKNKIRLDSLQEIRAMRDAERSGDYLAIAKLQEDRASKNFDRGIATDALAVLSDTNFEGFEDYSPSEVERLEQKIGLPTGTLKNYATNSAKMSAVEGWESSIENNPSTGEVTAVYYRINPDTREIETIEQSFGNIGDRFKASSPSNNVSNLSDKELIQTDIDAIRGADNKLDTAKYPQVREKVKSGSPELLSWFDKTYPPDEYLNPNDPTASEYFKE